MAAGHLSQAVLTKSQANLGYLTLQHALVFVLLIGLRDPRVNVKVLVGNDDLALKFIFFLLFQSIFFLGHVIARDKHCVEKFRRREGRLLSGDSGHEDRLAFILGSILVFVEGSLGLECLLNVWITKSFDLRGVGFLYMLVPI